MQMETALVQGHPGIDREQHPKDADPGSCYQWHDDRPEMVVAHRKPPTSNPSDYLVRAYPRCQRGVAIRSLVGEISVVEQ
jgi:hypothetical protein